MTYIYKKKCKLDKYGPTFLITNLQLYCGRTVNNINPIQDSKRQ